MTATSPSALDFAPPYRSLNTDHRSLSSSLPPSTWPQFWAWANRRLRADGYRHGSRRLYRQVLRAFHTFCQRQREAFTTEFPFAYPLDAPNAPTPREITANDIRAYLDHLGDRRLSASWIGMNTSILRALFDRLGGQDLTANLRGPRRGNHLPRWLSRDEVHTLLSHAPTTRDRLLLSLLYGCGLKVGEAVRLQWKHLSDDAHTLTLPARPFRCVPGRPRPTAHPRTVPVPERLEALLREERSWRTEDACLFPGRRQGMHLSVRAANRIVHQCVRRAGLAPNTCAMHLRHAFAIHALEDGMNPRGLQKILGHRSIETTLIYQRCLLPDDAPSPLDQIPADALDAQPTKLPAPEPTQNSPEPEAPPHSHPTLDPRPRLFKRFLSALRDCAKPSRHGPIGAHPPPT